MPLVSFEQKSGSDNVNLHSVFVVLQVTSSTKNTFYEVFTSAQTDQILADQILDYLL